MPPGVGGRRTAPTSIPEPQIFYPTMEEFSDFMGYIHKIETEGKANIANLQDCSPCRMGTPQGRL